MLSHLYPELSVLNDQGPNLVFLCSWLHTPLTPRGNGGLSKYNTLKWSISGHGVGNLYDHCRYMHGGGGGGVERGEVRVVSS